MIKEEVKKIIKDELSKIGYNPIYVGTNYLIDTIYFCYELNIPTEKLNLNRDIYTKVSKIYCKNIKTIKSDIIKATNLVILNEMYIKEYSCLKNLKITPKLVICLVTDKLKQ